jgi:hypothetical protein
MLVSWDTLTQSVERPGSVAFRPEENGTLVVVDTNDRVSRLIKMQADLGTDQPARSGHQDMIVSHNVSELRRHSES